MLYATNFWVKPWLINILFWLLTSCSILLPIIWALVWKSGIEFYFPFIHKSLYSGRERIWQFFLDHFLENPLFGIGQGSVSIPLMGYSEYTPHNFMFFILVVYGAIVFIFSLIILNRILIGKYHYAMENSYAKIALAGLLSILITSFFEIIPISYIHVIMVWFLLVVINSSQGMNKHKNNFGVK